MEMDGLNFLKRQSDTQREAYSNNFTGDGNVDVPKTATAAQLAARKIRQPKSRGAARPSQTTTAPAINPFASINLNTLPQNTNNQSTTSTNSFSFGAPTQPPSFNFGFSSNTFGGGSNPFAATKPSEDMEMDVHDAAPATTEKPAEAPKPTFNIFAQNSDATQKATETPKSLFSLPAAQPTPAAQKAAEPPKSLFSLPAAQPTPAVEKAAEASKPLFSFSAAQATPAVEKAVEPTKSLFSLPAAQPTPTAQKAAETPKSLFSLPAAQPTPAVEKAAEAPKPLFSFGSAQPTPAPQKAAETPKPLFSLPAAPPAAPTYKPAEAVKPPFSVSPPKPAAPSLSPISPPASTHKGANITTFVPPKLPSYLNEGGRNKVDKAFRVKALNIEFKKRIMKIDAAKNDATDALVRFYVACREKIGQPVPQPVSPPATTTAAPPTPLPAPVVEPPKAPAFKIPSFGNASAPTDFMSQFGAQAKKNLEVMQQEARAKRKAEEFDSDEDDEAEFDRKLEEEERAKRAKIEALSKSPAVFFKPTTKDASAAPKDDDKSAKAATEQPKPSSSSWFPSVNSTPSTSGGASVFDQTWKPQTPIKFTPAPATSNSQDDDDDAAEDADKENDATAAKEQQEKQASLMDTRPGEENEEVLHEVRAKLMKQDEESKEWKSMGVGPLRVLKNKETGKARMVLRADPGASVVMNSSLRSGISYKPLAGGGDKGAGTIKFADVNKEGKLESRVLKVKNQEMAQKLSEVLEQAKTA